MNTFVKNNINKFLLGVFALGFLVTPIEHVYASTSFNDNYLDFQTLRVVNYTDRPNSDSSTWGTSVSADAGEIVNFAIYYHNNGSETARNVRVRLTPQSTGTASSHTFTAYIWSDNSAQVSGSANVSLSSSQSLSYNNLIWRPNQTVWGSQALLNGQNGDAVFSQQGLLIGDISAGWSSQGNVIISFQVSNNIIYSPVNYTTYNPRITNVGSGPAFSEIGWGFGSSNTYNPNTIGYISNNTANNNYVYYNNNSRVVTNPVTDIGYTYADLNGFAVINSGSVTRGWFEWGITPSLGNITVRNYIGYNSSINFKQSISGLSTGTVYYYRAVIENSQGIQRGDILTFRTVYFYLTPNNNTESVSNNVVTTSVTNYFPNLVRPIVSVVKEKGNKSVSIKKTVENINRQNGSSVSVYAHRGDIVRFTITLENTGDVNLKKLKVKDSINSSLELISKDTDMESVDKEIVWSVDVLRHGQSVEIIFDAMVKKEASFGEIINIASVEVSGVKRFSNETYIKVKGEESSVSKTASVFAGSIGFMPHSLIEWLLTFALTVLIFRLLKGFFEGWKIVIDKDITNK